MLFILSLCFLLIVNVVHAAESLTPIQIVQKVHEAAELIVKQGKGVVSEFNDPQGRWVWQNSYIAIIDCSLQKTVAHPFTETLQKVDNSRLQYLVMQICKSTQVKKNPWIKYRWFKPGEDNRSLKFSYTLRAQGTPYQLIAGFHNTRFTTDQLNKMTRFAGKKVLHLASYDPDFLWTKKINDAILNVLQDKGIVYETFYMDSKRYQQDAFLQQMAKKAKNFIEAFQPDVIISSDDNAARYVIAPYFKNSSIPILFCGINWDASVYGFPTANITGMIEKEFIRETVQHLKRYAKGNRLGLLAFNGYTEQKNIQYYPQLLRRSFERIVLVEDFYEWRDAFLQLQNQVDMLVLYYTHRMKNWDDQTARQFVEKNTKIPTGALHEWMMQYAMLGIVKMPSEYGSWAAKKALDILEGTKISDIPMTENQEGRLVINMRIVNQLEIDVDFALLKTAEIIR